MLQKFPKHVPKAEDLKIETLPAFHKITQA